MLTDKEKLAVRNFVERLIENDLIDPRIVPHNDKQFFEWWKQLKSQQEVWEQMLIYNNRNNIPQA
jgi:hypothetical protein